MNVDAQRCCLGWCIALSQEREDDAREDIAAACGGEGWCALAVEDNLARGEAGGCVSPLEYDDNLLLHG